MVFETPNKRIPNRNYLFVRSIAFSVITKLSGFFVVFACLPLAALSLTASEYAAFNYSMASTGILAIAFGPIGSTYVVRLAQMATLKQHELTRLAESALTVFLTLGVALELPAVMVAYTLSPAEFKFPIATAAAAVIATSALSWAEVFRLGTRQDHISSAFGLATNLSIIFGFSILFKFQRLSFQNVMEIYYFTPLFWAIISFAQLLYTTGVRIRLRIDRVELRKAVTHAMPNIANSFSDYLKLYGSSFIAFYLSSSQSYAAFSTVQLLIARLTNPLSLIARPLIPACVDAVARNDTNWITGLRKIILLICVLGFAGVCLVSLAAIAMAPEEVRLGAVVLGQRELAQYSSFGALLFVSTVSLILLASVYLALHQMAQFSKTTLITNCAAILLGGFITPLTGPIAMFASVTIGSTLASLSLLWRFPHTSHRISSAPR